LEFYSVTEAAKQQLAMQYARQRENFPILEANRHDREKDRAGSATAVAANELRFFGAARYLLYGDVIGFREQVSSSASLLGVDLPDRFDRGEAISPSYVSLLLWKPLLDAFAAADEQLGLAIASRMGGRTEVEEKYDHPWDRAFGAALKHGVLRERDAAERIRELERETTKRVYFGSSQLVATLRSIEQEADPSAAFHELVRAHKRMSSKRGVLGLTIDAKLFMWGIGLANLARSRGIDMAGFGPLIPDDLLMTRR
jgi:hypothetical protein